MSDGQVIQITHKFETIYCYKCGIPFAVPSNIRRRWVDSGDSFYCPSGHSQCYTESTVQRLKKQLQQEKKFKEWAKQDAINARDEARFQANRARAQKAAKTRIKNRIAAGVCPCCNRTFKNLARHMTSQHPDFSHKSDAND